MTKLISTLLAFFSVSALASVPAPGHEAIYDTRNKVWISLEALAEQMQPGTVLVLGETHFVSGSEKSPIDVQHHQNQVRWLETLDQSARKRGFTSHLGMEFLEYTNQATVDQYLAGHMTEDEFKAAVGWGSNPFAPYRDIMWAAPTHALNIPRGIARQVAKEGPSTLTSEQRALVPPLWERGSDLYYQLFLDSMGGHGDPTKMENYFWAQSLWDDTMAWKALDVIDGGGKILTIVVGEFHAQFGLGLPARLNRHGASNVRTMVQVNVQDFADKEDFVRPDPDYGDRADYIWVYSLP